ncbi:MAG: hypothetical protein UU48_C0002G0091 [Candidatus Uhrbacteria bacterium GW2011_GWF2_41_16]|uniref:Uncharacterized protein n=2 Tax=Candidatus Uhriibacteriota TaxID=1752732 RepID=A0A0G0VFY1_9BACT|nr:MAG: hypothetical protein UU35_C0002G0077 [Candidatus Uhrbacteria bacterium GW2011_GWC2_41_11]KKR98556.1 MAG: hypothetical protein UU48_C0002G0091 [Candidatus Uhrbacteria bacterium GW2011_GWF2_41_16]HBO99907.1 hypothetical protein [Candidatus Uhrbacteria bacterium]
MEQMLQDFFNGKMSFKDLVSKLHEKKVFKFDDEDEILNQFCPPSVWKRSPTFRIPEAFFVLEHPETSWQRSAALSSLLFASNKTVFELDGQWLKFSTELNSRIVGAFAVTHGGLRDDLSDSSAYYLRLQTVATLSIAQTIRYMTGLSSEKVWKSAAWLKGLLLKRVSVEWLVPQVQAEIPDSLSQSADLWDPLGFDVRGHGVHPDELALLLAIDSYQYTLHGGLSPLFSDAFFNAMRRIASRTLNTGEMAIIRKQQSSRFDSPMFVSDTLFVRPDIPLGPPLLARQVLHNSGAKWLAGLSLEAFIETLDYLSLVSLTGKDPDLAKGEWILMALYREGKELSLDHLHRAAQYWNDLVQRVAGEKQVNRAHLLARAGIGLFRILDVAQKAVLDQFVEWADLPWKPGLFAGLAKMAAKERDITCWKRNLTALADMLFDSTVDDQQKLDAAILLAQAFQDSADVPIELKMSLLEAVKQEPVLERNVSLRIELRRSELM